MRCNPAHLGAFRQIFSKAFSARRKGVQLGDFRSRVICCKDQLAAGIFIFSPRTSNLRRLFPLTKTRLASRVPDFSWADAAFRQKPIVKFRSSNASLGIVESRRGGNPKRWIGRTENEEIVFPLNRSECESYTKIRNALTIRQPSFRCFRAADGSAFVVEKFEEGEVLSRQTLQSRFPIALLNLADDLVRSATNSKPLEKKSELEISGGLGLATRRACVPSHGDLSIENVLIPRSGSYKVIDWDADYLGFLPAYFDLTTLIVSCAHPSSSYFDATNSDVVVRAIRESPLRGYLENLLASLSIQRRILPDTLEQVAEEWIRVRHRLRGQIKV